MDILYILIFSHLNPKANPQIGTDIELKSTDTRGRLEEIFNLQQDEESTGTPKLCPELPSMCVGDIVAIQYKGKPAGSWNLCTSKGWKYINLEKSDIFDTWVEGDPISRYNLANSEGRTDFVEESV